VTSTLTETATDRLTGEHLGLRPLRPADESTFTRIHTSPVLTRYLGVDRMDEPQARAAFDRALRPSDRRHTFAVTTTDDDTMHGLIGLLVEDYGHNAMITGLVLLPGAPVRGHAAEAGRLLLALAFGRLGRHRVWAGHRQDHTRMRQVMLDAGLRPEAVLRQLFRTGGRWHDVCTYAALAPEWWPGATAAERAIRPKVGPPMP
jgi:ribosomal-protein-alanine N-acetyltransferase